MVATDRYAADDGINKVVVEYEPLPVVIDPFKAMDKDAPVLREDLAGKTSGAHGPRKHHNHIFEWTVGDKDLTDAAFSKAEVTIKEMISYHRTHPSPLETCQCVCSFDKIKGELTIWGTFQAPHVIRTVVALIAKIAGTEDPRDLARRRRRFRQQGRRLSRLYLCGGGLDRHRQTGQMGRGPHREPDRDLVCARLPHDDRDRRDQGRQGHRPCAFTCSPITARSTPAPIRRNGRPASSTSSPAPTTSRPRICRSTASTPTRRRAASPIAARSASPRRPIASSAAWISWRRSSAWIRPNCG